MLVMEGAGEVTQARLMSPTVEGDSGLLMGRWAVHYPIVRRCSSPLSPIRIRFFGGAGGPISRFATFNGRFFDLCRCIIHPQTDGPSLIAPEKSTNHEECMGEGGPITRAIMI